jgi:hypothetical protein
MRNAYSLFFGKPEAKRTLGIRRYRWEDKIKKDHREIGWEIIDWIYFVQDRDQWRALVNNVMDFRVS